MELSAKAKQAMSIGSMKIRVLRNGMLQQLTFRIRRVTQANITYTELYTERLVDISELTRVANEIGLPVEAQNGKAFPNGTSAGDFILSY
ncbi:MAG: hypothetical protein KGH72_05065 [Candidatus Micrarchaeota archaeon]|nr:hypothetical protein [Candidatus Micrarchaeota archaeon]